MAECVNDNTVLVVGSAPQYPQGVIDPIPELAELAATVGASMHVDACMGGFVLPFMELNGEPVAPWDFRVPASPRSRPTSTSSATRRRARRCSCTARRRSGATRRSSSTTGSAASTRRRACRAAGPVCRWRRRGPSCTGSASTATGGSPRSRSTRRERLIAGIRRSPALEVLGEPDAHVFAMSSPELDVFALGDALHGGLASRSPEAARQPARDRERRERAGRRRVPDRSARRGRRGRRARTDDRGHEYATLE